MREKIASVIVAGGAGRRFGQGGPAKQFRQIRGVPVLEWALHPFVQHPDVHRTVVVLPAEQAAAPPGWLRRHDVEIVPGGELRSDSVRAGLRAIGSSFERVLIHDGARPFASRELIDRLLAVDGAAIPGVPLTDTVKEVDESGVIVRTLDRSRLWGVQTPQLFPLMPLLRAHERAEVEELSTSDDAALFEWMGLPVRIIAGDPRNLKVTTPTDLAVAEMLAHGLPLPAGVGSGEPAAPSPGKNGDAQRD